MLWFKQISKQTLKSKAFLWCITVASLFILGKGIYHAKQEPQTVLNLSKQIEDEMELNGNKAAQLEQKQKKQPVEYYEAYRQLLLEEYHALTAANFKLRQKNLDIAAEMNTFYRLLSQEKQYDAIVPIDFASVEEKIIFTDYLIAHQLLYIEDVFPFDNAFFSLQIAHVFFNFGTAFLLVALFGLQIYRDIETEKFTYLYTLPIKRKRLLKQYSWYLALTLGSYITLFLTSFIPLLLSQNARTLLYPYIIKNLDTPVIFPLWQIIGFIIIS